MNGKENLIPLSKRTKGEQRKIAATGGRASGRARREKREFRKLIEIALSTRVKDEKGNEIISEETGRPISRKAAAAIRLAEKCSVGDLKAIELAAELLGEKVVKAEVTGKNGGPVVERSLSLEEAKAILKQLNEDY